MTAALEAFDVAVLGQDHGGRFAFWNASARAAGQPRRGAARPHLGRPAPADGRPGRLRSCRSGAQLAHGTGQPVTAVALGVYRPDRVLTWLRVDAVPVPAAGLGGTAVVSRLVGR